VLKFFLEPENKQHWAKIQDLVTQNTAQADQMVREYVLEAQRLTSTQRNLRICKQQCTVDGVNYNPGDAIVCLLVRAPLSDSKYMYLTLTGSRL
jgi:hypothetical protein